ncbi:hypothetical protein BHE74_00011631 [Ensete ventricosum]|nr:hypothetical protein BHE74_00011631 [Ensete ventricosum]RZR86468.1 hypothetical protein BHM03_00013670 [Ensete ventricosum]
MSRRRGWGFGVNWSAHSVSNVPPNLSDEESILVGQLKDILSTSQAIRNLTEEWLVEAGLSPAPAISKDKGPVGPTEETLTPSPKPRSVRELCSTRPGVDDRDYHAIRMSSLPKRAPDAPLEMDLTPLTYGEGI